jgi:FkbM family methyltransferase
MYDQFIWTPESEMRGAILRKFEPVQPSFFFALSNLFRPEIFLDIGSNVGHYSIFFSKINTIERIHAFEPSSETFRNLARNIELNNLSEKIRPHRTALSSKHGAARLNIVSPLSGANSLNDDWNEFSTHEEVEIAPLDSILRHKSRRISFKIDVEGHEKGVIEGAREILKNNYSILQIEEIDYSKEDILGEIGYKILCRVGNDAYYSNSDVPDRDVVRSFEFASKQIIAESLIDRGRKKRKKSRIRRMFSRLRGA